MDGGRGHFSGADTKTNLNVSGWRTGSYSYCPSVAGAISLVLISTQSKMDLADWLADYLADWCILLLPISDWGHFLGADLYTKIYVSRWLAGLLVVIPAADQWQGSFLR